jgi:Acetyltransferase (GNAT) domain
MAKNENMREQYLNFCKNTEGVSIFMQPWFLDAVCGSDKWAACMDIANNGDVNGAMVYHFVDKWFFKILQMPTLTGCMGIWLRDDVAWKTEYRSSFEKTVLKNLINQLPKTAFSLQMYAASLQNWLPFLWAGYRVEPMMNCVIDNLGDTALVWENLKDSVRTKIRKAQKLNLTVEIRDDIDTFYTLICQTVNRIGYKTGITKSILYQLHEEIRRRDAGKIFFAVDKMGVIHAAFYIIWDTKKAIYWIPTMNQDTGNSGATRLLLWEILQELSRRGIPRFEAMGSMSENLEPFMTTFGAKQETYWKMTRYSNAFFGLLHTLKKYLN